MTQNYHLYVLKVRLTIYIINYTIIYFVLCKNINQQDTYFILVRYIHNAIQIHIAPTKYDVCVCVARATFVVICTRKNNDDFDATRLNQQEFFVILIKGFVCCYDFF